MSRNVRTVSSPLSLNLTPHNVEGPPDELTASHANYSPFLKAAGTATECLRDEGLLTG